VAKSANGRTADIFLGQIEQQLFDAGLHVRWTYKRNIDYRVMVFTSMPATEELPTTQKTILRPLFWRILDADLHNYFDSAIRRFTTGGYLFTES